MLTQALATKTDSAAALLISYSFDLSGYTARELIDRWLNDYPANWIRLAVIEALYQGRYKAISVEQILTVWLRRDHALYHFNHEFERLICGDIIPRPRRELDNQAEYFPPATKAAVHVNDGDGSEAVTVELGTSDRQVQSVNAAHITPSASKSNRALPPSKNYQSSYQQQVRSPNSNSNSASQPSIKRFNPASTDSSDFYFKLKAIAQFRDGGESRS